MTGLFPRSLRPLLLVALVAVAGCESDPTGAEPVPESCDDVSALPPLSVGEGVRVEGSAAVLLCPTHSGSGADEYVLVLHNGTGDPDAPLTLRVRTRGLTPPGDEPEEGAVAAPYRAPPAAATAARTPDPGQHLGLRRLERDALARRVGPGPGAPEAAARAPRADAPGVGTLLEGLNIQSREACGNPVFTTGEVMAVSESAVVVADVENPAGGFNRFHYERIAATFDTLVAPLAHEAFGTPSDLSGDGRTILYYTRAVNELTPPEPDGFVLGFFFARDLFPREGTDLLQGCEHSNEAEMLYLLVPDPDGEINGNPWDPETVEQRTLATIVHEYQHLINAGHRLHKIRTASFLEEAWLNEALSHVAEELLFYRVSGLESRSDLGIRELRDAGNEAIAAMNAHQLMNVQRLERYLEDPAGNSPYAEEALLPTRGAAWSFLRYALDRKGGDQTAVLRGLVDAPHTGVDNLAAALGGEALLLDWMADWSVALYGDSRVPGLPAAYRDRSWNHPSIFAALDEQTAFPLRPEAALAEGTATTSMSGGGTRYLRFALSGGGSSIELTRDGARPPSALRATLLRIR